MKGFSKNKKGISLIVLVITIIVMIILAAAIILSLNGSDIIGKSNEAKTDSDKANLLEAANVALAEYELKVNTGEEMTDELSDYVKEQLTKQGFKEEEIDKLDIDDEKRTVEYNDESALVHNGIIPEGGTYYVGVQPVYDGYFGDNIYKPGDYTGATAIYTVGDEFPKTVNVGDVYVYGDYEYRYKYELMPQGEGERYIENSSIDWGARVLDNTKISYGEIVSEINGKKVELVFTFGICENMVTAPAIPQSVTNINEAFTGCTSLTTAPVIPTNVKSAQYTFAGCVSLTGEVEINASKLDDYEGLFFNPSGERQQIVLTGTCPREQLEAIAAEYDNVDVKKDT